MSATATRRRLGMAVATATLAATAAFATVPARAGAGSGPEALPEAALGAGLGGWIGADTPETTITAGPQNGETVGDVPPTFTFESSAPGSTFECRTYDPANPRRWTPVAASSAAARLTSAPT